MARTPARFKETEVVRLIKAARAGGMDPTGVEVLPDGTVRVSENARLQEPVTEFDRWKSEL